MEEAGKRGTRVELPLSRWENKGVWSDGGQPSGQSKTVQRHCAVLWQNTENRSSHSKKCTPAYFRVPKHLNACLDFQVHVEYILQCLQTSEKEGVEVSRNRRCRDKVWKEKDIAVAGESPMVGRAQFHQRDNEAALIPSLFPFSLPPTPSSPTPPALWWVGSLCSLGNNPSHL